MKAVLRGILLLAICTGSLPALGAQASGYRSEADIAKMSLDEISVAVQRNTGNLQIFYNELRRRYPNRFPPRDDMAAPVQPIDAATLARLSDDELMKIFQDLGKENDRLIARGEALLLKR